ncbi:MAG TPA: chorismate mutase [Candidatus Sulfotelmatobacter sp.]|nr:chorismate mutase [Candidatus Sulfotelmatobacter sp.]
MPVRGIRGATTATANTAEAITDATEELLSELVRLNDLDPEEIAFAYFTTTPDLNAEYPAIAARRLGWLDVPLLCGHDMNVPQPNPRAVPMCIRILLLYNSPRPQSTMRFAYLRGADAIKADLDYMRGTLETGGLAR